MVYKQQANLSNEEKLDNLYDEHKVPLFVRTQLDYLKTASGKIQYLYTLVEYFNFLINERLISVNSISEVTDESLAKVPGNQCNKYFDYLKEKGNADSTIQTKIKKISSFYTKCIDDDELVIERNPIKRVKKKQFSEIVKVKDKKMVGDNDINKLLENVEYRRRYSDYRTRDLAIIHLFLGSGIRESEMAGLDLEDLVLDVENPYITVIRKGYLKLKSQVYISNKAKEY